MAITKAGRLFYCDDAVITLDGSGNGTKVVGFPTTFVGAPQCVAVKAAGAAGTFTCGSITESQMTITVAGDTTRLNQRISVIWFAAERV